MGRWGWIVGGFCFFINIIKNVGILLWLFIMNVMMLLLGLFCISWSICFEFYDF